MSWTAYPDMLRRAWRLGAAARGGAASTSAVPPSSGAHAVTTRARLAPWSAAPLSSRADGPDELQARRRALRRAARRDLRAWRGADLTPRELRELRELKDGGGSKRRWARDWASAVFADDVGDGASYEVFVAEALRHGDGRRGPGSGPASETGTDTRRARREKKKMTRSKTKQHGSGVAGSGAPQGGGPRGVKPKRRRGDRDVRSEASRRRSSRDRRGRRDDEAAAFDWHEERARDDADAFWRAFMRAARGFTAKGAPCEDDPPGLEDFGDFGAGEFEDSSRSTRAREKKRSEGREGTFRGKEGHRSRDAGDAFAFPCPDRSALGIAPGAALDKKLLKASLRAAAMKWHPDRHAGADAKRDAEAEFKKCYDAYDSLVKRTC